LYPTRHALLRDRRSWRSRAWPTATHALVADDDGTLSLMHLPRPLASVELPPPYEVEASGLAAAPCLGLFVADSARNRVIFRDDLCCDTAQVAPVACECVDGVGFAAPRGLAYSGHGLAVADSGHARVLRYRVETLLLAGSLHGPFAAPHGVAVDAKGRSYIVDAATEHVYRLEKNGAVDVAYGAALAALVAKPRFLALGANDALWVSDAASDAVHRFAEDGAALPPLPGATSDWKPRALAVADGRSYVADARSGHVYAFDGDACLGKVPGYRGPVSALAIGDDGSLYIKPGHDEQVIVACAALGTVALGEVRAGPIDAGERSDWERVALDVDAPAGASIELSVFFADTAAPDPADNEWIAAPAPDLLLASVVSASVPVPGQVRYLWLRVRLRPAPNGDSPQLRQVHAATADEDYRQWLPSVYAENDADGVLKRLLALARSEVGGAEALIADLPRLASPDFVPAASLPWLADWLDFELPADLPTAPRREVLLDAFRLLRKRGTVAGLLAWIHLHTGIRLKLLEWAKHRRIWQLGITSALGFDTALPAASADGIGVADPAMLAKTDPAWGCRAPERIVVGHSVVGADRPATRADFGSDLFDEHAHRLTLFVPPGQASDKALRARVQALVEAEKPAHVSCEVCFVEAEMRIGMAARVGLDAVVAGAGEPMRLAQSALGHETRLGGTPPPTGTVGQNARIGSGLVLG
jgi:phage tail-like protein